MGPVSEYNLKIAPAFYITQVDLTGPFKAYSKQSKRATLKIWLVVFCCATTTTINIKVMEDAPLHSLKHLKYFLAKLVIQKCSYQMKEASSSKNVHQ